MKANQLSRLELLQWLNELVQTDYPKVESLCDGIGFCQVIDAIHPNSINLSKLNFNSKFPDEFALNLKILDDAFKKLRIEKQVRIDKISQGKFQENINFLQWVYNYAQKIGPSQYRGYNGYQRRQEALSKQRHNNNKTMSVHLVPNNAFLNKQENLEYDENTFEEHGNQQFYNQQQQQQNFLQQNQFQGMQQSNSQFYQQQQQQQGQQQQEQKVDQLNEFIENLEEDLKTKMEYNWKILYALDDMIYQRNTLYDILRNIEYLTYNYEDSQTKQTILQILGNTPTDFMPDHQLSSQQQNNYQEYFQGINNNNNNQQNQNFDLAPNQDGNNQNNDMNYQNNNNNYNNSNQNFNQNNYQM
ncbi:Calponin homology domain [Pseudocohnilembus persalinus]|uniref:Calponin homology domain n=1 Tax=Pseudocohnilembus persalinus TaxID=266149 RepID=A0A0V0Q886_PSEPJ|nr:Calponin homology domain [Pseudocohnilembus persalinus]|eukprot:KRW98441.1 Calponin homology domain [Pseudocohnilembus persalinus]